MDPYEKGDDFDPARIAWVMDDADLENLLNVMIESDEVVMDLETTGLDEHSVTNGPTNGGVAARVALAAVTVVDKGWYDIPGYRPINYVVPLSHPDSPLLGKWRDVLRRICQTIAHYKLPLNNQNVKYDCRYIKATTGVDLSERIVWDPMMASHLLDENSSKKLKERAPAVFDIEPWDEHDLSYPGAAEKVDMIELGIYGAQDTYWTWRLSAYQRAEMFLLPGDEPFGAEEVEHARLGKIAVRVDMPKTATLTAMEQRGIGLDTEYAEEKLREADQIVAESRQWLVDRYADEYERLEIDPDGSNFSSNSIWFRAWASHAVDVGDLRVASLTPTGQPQWTSGVLTKQARNGSEVAETLLRFKDYEKRAQFMRSWLASAHGTGRIFSNYNAASVVTGRLSSSGPNMQQVAKSLRPCFVPSPGYYLADIDYSQIELRVAAHMSQSIAMIESYQNGDDLHKVIARQIMQLGEDRRAREADEEPRYIELDEVTPEERQKGKAGNFGLLYGMGAMGFQLYAESAYNVILTEDEAQEVYRAFFETWDGVGQWHARQITAAHRDGQVTSPIGRVRRLPDIFSANDRKVSGAERQAINAPVQGFASDLMQMASASIEGRLNGREPVSEARLVGTVHDSILVEVPIETWEETTQKCIDRMVGVADDLKRLDCHLSVPLVAEAAVSTRWGLSDVGELG